MYRFLRSTPKPSLIGQILDTTRGVLHTPDYLGLTIGIWANLELDFANFSTFYHIMGKYCLLELKSGIYKMITYAPGDGPGEINHQNSSQPWYVGKEAIIIHSV